MLTRTPKQLSELGSDCSALECICILCAQPAISLQKSREPLKAC